MARMTRREYAAMYGPTRGDAVRLGDTSLLAEIEHDYAVPGDESLHVPAVLCRRHIRRR